MAAPAHRYLIALGSNRRHARFGAPRRVLAAALERLEAEGVHVVASAPMIETDPIGPSIRRYANSAAVIETELEPEELLATLKRIEREFGRRASGQRWRARVLDLDIVLWSGGAYPPPRQGRGKGWGRSRADSALTRPTPTPPLKGRGSSAHASPSLTIPHPLFRERRFVLDPAVAIAPDWRDPLTGATVRQLHARLTRNQALPKRAAGEGP
jgi:2-amino-4-hydroxy-6-hydroxymethyldihydropteridine diphosphokinase